MTEISVFITNLGRYNEGELVGEWLELPASVEEISESISRIGINEEYEEWFLTDWEVNSEIDIDIGEYSDIYTLNEIAEQISNLDEREKIAAAILLNDYGADWAEVLSIIENGDYILLENIKDYSYLGMALADENGDVPDDLYNYIDWEEYGEVEGQDYMLDYNCAVRVYR